MRNVFHLFRVGLLLLGAHGLRQILHFKVSSSLCWYNKSLFSSEESTGFLFLSGDGRVDSPVLIIRVLDLNLLDSGFTNNGLKVELFSLRAFLRDTITNEVNLHGLSSSYFAWHVSLNIAVNNLRVECDLNVHVGIWVNISGLRINSKVLAERFLIPFKLSLYISKVTHLHGLRESAIFHYVSESQSVLHELKFNAVSNSNNREDSTIIFNTFNFKHNLLRERRKSNLGVKPNHNWKHFLGLESVSRSVRDRDGHCACCKGGWVGWSYLEFDSFLTLVQDRNGLRCKTVNRDYAEVGDRLVGIFQVKHKWDSLCLNNNVHLVQIVEI